MPGSSVAVKTKVQQMPPIYSSLKSLLQPKPLGDEPDLTIEDEPDEEENIPQHNEPRREAQRRPQGAKPGAGIKNNLSL